MSLLTAFAEVFVKDYLPIDILISDDVLLKPDRYVVK